MTPAFVIGLAGMFVLITPPRHDQETRADDSFTAMNVNFGRSQIFELVADGDVRFFVHEDVLTSQSEPFRMTAAGEWKEATERKINLSDWDADTVSRLLQYLYSGDYQYPDPTSVSQSLDPTAANEATVPTQAKDEQKSIGMDVKRPLTPLKEWRKKAQLSRQNDNKVVSDWTRLERFKPAQYDFKEVLLTHARIYALANYKLVQGLQNLALERLLITLAHLDPIPDDSHLSMNLVDLASYGYSNTTRLSNSNEPLRDLISQFAALNFEALQNEPLAIEFIGQGGDFVKDITMKLCRRLSKRQGTPSRATSSTKFISRLRVVNGPEPADRVGELRHTSSNINYPHGDQIWIVPEYTDAPSEACTGFDVSFGGSYQSNDNLAVHEGEVCFLVPVKDENNQNKITQVALVRGESILSGSPILVDYQGITGNIKQPWSSPDDLHLVWKTVKVSI